MKKIIILLTLIVFISSAFAQEEVTETAPVTKLQEKVVNKKGQNILPEAGDLAVGIDMVPFLNYLGNFANNSVNNSYNGNFLATPNTLFAKYFLDQDLAIRGRVMIMSNNFQNKQYVVDDAALYNDPNSNDRVVDVMQTVSHDYMIGAGIEKRRGKGRLRGFFAGEINLMFGADKTMYTYGNNYSELNQDPTVYNFGANDLGVDRLVENNDGTYFGVGLGAYLGVEYFIMPNICLGSEVGWQINYTENTQETSIIETWNGNEAEEITILNSPGNANFNYGFNNPTASLYIMFHF